jgi:hypothetical protein
VLNPLVKFLAHLTHGKFRIRALAANFGGCLWPERLRAFRLFVGTVPDSRQPGTFTERVPGQPEHLVFERIKHIETVPLHLGDARMRPDLHDRVG